MDILLSLNEESIKMLFFSFFVVCAFSLTMLSAYFFSKSFVNSELDRLEKTTSKFDKLIILVSGAVISAVIVVFGVLITGVAAKFFYTNSEKICYSYIRLIVAFSTILIISYTLVAPNHSDHRLLDVSDKEAKNIYEKFLRIAVISFLITVVSYPIIMMLKNTQYKVAFELFTIGFVIIYYFCEMLLSKKTIGNILKINQTKEYLMSEKLATFVNNKFPYFALGCMLCIVFISFSNNNSDELAIFIYMNNIYLFLLEIFIFQSIVSAFINKFLHQIESLDDGVRSERYIRTRTENLIWICDIVVLAFYFVLLCIAINYAGIDVKKYILHDNIITIFIALFITMILFKGFREYKEVILEKAENEDNEHYIKLKTFMPTISVVFYGLLIITSIMVTLSNIGINITPVLAIFSLFSAAVGLAATDIIKSFLHGVILLIERNLFIGEFIQINDELKGVIEKLSVRVLYLRDDDGKVNIIPYSHINSITNFSKEYTIHSDSLLLSSSKDIDKAKKILINVVNSMKKDGPYKDVIIGDVVIHGMSPFDMAGVKIEWEIKTDTTGSHVINEVYSRLINEFKKQKIEIPMANNVNVNVK